MKEIMFTPYKIGSMTIKNRLVRSATYEQLAHKDGSVSTQLVDFYKDLARGGVGLIITGHANVLPNGQAAGNQTGIYDDKFITGLRKITDNIHENVLPF